MIRLARILVSPRQVFDGMRDKATFALPLWSILIVAFVCLLLIFINYDDVTAGVLQDDGTVMREVDPQLVFFLGTGAVVVWAWSSILSVCLLLAWASYYWVAGKVLRVDVGWRNWFGFACWTAVPGILGSVADLFVAKLGGPNPPITFSSLPGMIGWFGTTHFEVYWIPFSLVWTLYIAVNGIMSWTQKSLLTSLAIVTPTIVLAALQPIALEALS